MKGFRHNKWAAGTIKLTVLLVVIWMFISLVGRWRGENPHAERNPIVTVLLVSCLLGGAALTIAVPVMGAMSIAQDSMVGKVTSVAAILVEAITLVLSICYIFPHGLGK